MASGMVQVTLGEEAQRNDAEEIVAEAQLLQEAKVADLVGQRIE